MNESSDLTHRKPENIMNYASASVEVSIRALGTIMSDDPMLDMGWPCGAEAKDRERERVRRGDCQPRMNSPQGAAS